MRDWRRSCFDCMGGIADMTGANFCHPIPLATPVAAPVETGPIRRWNDPRMSQKRKKLLAVIGNLLPQAYWTEEAPFSGKASAAHGGGDFRQMFYWAPKDGGTSCTGFNGSVGYTLTDAKSGKWSFDAHTSSAWVPWGVNPDKPMPSVGDVYLLFRDICKDPPVGDTDSPHLRHCGFILHVPKTVDEPWITADAGQNLDGRQVGWLNRRPWETRLIGKGIANKPLWEQTVAALPYAKPLADTEYPYLGGGAESMGSNLDDANRLIGWVDLDAAEFKFKKEAFDAKQPKARPYFKYTEDDYLALGARIDAMLAMA